MNDTHLSVMCIVSVFGHFQISYLPDIKKADVLNCSDLIGVDIISICGIEPHN